MSSIVKKPFEFTTYNSPIPIGIGEGVLVSCEVYTHEPGIGCNNAVKITVHGPNGDVILDGPYTIYLKDYLREVEYNDLVHPKEYMFEQQKDRTYREGQKDNTVTAEPFVEECVLKDNRNKREYVACVIEYLKSIDINKENANKTIGSWIPQEIDRLNSEFSRLSVLTMSDSDIIQTALIELGNEYLSKYDTEVANKITDVRNRYLDRKDKE